MTSTLPKPIAGVQWSLFSLLLICLAIITGCRATNHAMPGDTTPLSKHLWTLTPGDRLFYELRYESNSYSDLQALYGSVAAATRDHARGVSPQAYRVTVDATAMMTPLEREGTSIRVSFRFLNAQISAESQMGAMIDTDRVQLELARDTFCEIDQEGRLNSLLFDPSVSDATTNFVRTLLGLMQFAKPEDSGAEHWEIEEVDSSGNYRARYDVIDAPPSPSAERERTGPRAFRKTKLEYVAPESDETRELPDAPRAILPEGGIDLTFDFDKGRIETVSGDESQTILIAGKIVGGAHNSFHLTLSGEARATQEEIASGIAGRALRSHAVQTIGLSTAPSEQARLAAIYRSQLEDDSVEKVKSALEALEQGSSKVTYSLLYSKVKALIYLHPDTCPQMEMLLRSSDSSGPVFQLITSAFAAVGNPKAQDALISALQKSRDETDKIQLLIALGAVKRPTEKAQDAVEEIAWRSPMSSLARGGQLTLGSMAHNLRLFSPGRAADIVERATATLAGVSGAQTQLIALLGNAGAREALPVLQRFLDHPSAVIRRRTALALRFIDAQQADELLSKTLLSDADESVRIHAAIALEFRNVTQTNFEAQRAALLSDKSESLRIRVMRNLWSSRESFPEVVSLVKSLASSDSSRDVRGSAARLLSGS
jgi:HEAT repeat protein